MKHACAFCFLWVGVSLALGETYYWHPSNGNGGDLADSRNWTSRADGAGARPRSVSDDDFSDPGLGTAWDCMDRDGSDSTGTCELKNGRLLLMGKGLDFSEEKHFFTGLRRSDIKGGFDVIVRVDSQANTHAWAKAGILMANNMDDFTQGGVAHVSLTPGVGVLFEWNSAPPVGNIDKHATRGSGLGWPVWLRLVKDGASLSAWYRTDSTSAWLQVGVPQTTLGIRANSEIALFAVPNDSSGKALKTAAVLFDDFRGSGKFESRELDFRFDGTGTNHNAAASISDSFSAHTLRFGNYSGKFSFGAGALSLSGSCLMSQAMSLEQGTGSLLFTGGTGPDTLAPKVNDTLPAIRKSGAGALVLMNGSLRAGALRLEAGTLDLNGNGATLEGFAGVGGALTGLGWDDSLIVKGDADFSGLTGFSAPVGNVVILSMGAVTTRFNPGGKIFPKLTLWTWPTVAKATMVVGPGSFTTLNGLLLRNHLGATGYNGILDFRTYSPSAHIGGDILQVKEGTGQNLQILGLGNGVWTVAGNVSLSMEGESSPDSAVFRFVKPSGPQILTVPKGGLFSVVHDAGGILRLGAALTTAGFRHSEGSFDFNGYNLTVNGDLKVERGLAATLLNLAGRTLAVAGNAGFSGKAADQRIGLNPSGPWFLNVSGVLTGDSADIANSDARGFSNGIASKTCRDQGGNLNWIFWQPPAPPSVTRHPQNIIAKPGWKIGFSVQALGTPPLSYQWRKLGDTAVLSRDTLLALDSITPAIDGARFQCTVKNPFGSDTSRSALLSVHDCDTLFGTSADQTVNEGGMVTVVGRFQCANQWQWSPVSGTVPRILDPERDTLVFQAPRVDGDSLLVVEFMARFGAEWAAKKVSILVKNTIPNPEIRMDTVPAWNGIGARTLRPVLANASEIGGLREYPVRYRWTLNPPIVDTAWGRDSLVVSNPKEDGNLEIGVCADNGGTPDCGSAVMRIRRLAVTLSPARAGRPGPVRLEGHRVAWGMDGGIRVIDWQGRSLWLAWGRAGSSRELPVEAEAALRASSARMEFLTDSPAR